jgi:starch-binding outer membrane protein, SusD/RagB family
MKKNIILYLILSIILGSCKKFVDVSPSPTQIMNYKVFENDATATRAVIGIYIQMMLNNQFTSSNTTLYAGLSADELYYYSNDLKQEFLKNEIGFSNHDLIAIVFWNPAYRYIYAANACIEGLNKSQTLTASMKSRLIGEAKFIRAYCYFYLANLFGDVPLITTTSYLDNAIKARDPKSKVYDQIVKDLIDAEMQLTNDYPTAEKVRPNSLVASALLARVYLYLGDWNKANELSTKVINSGVYSLSTNLNSVFLKGSSETIFQLQPGASNINTWEGSTIIPTSNSALPTYLVTNTLLNSFETGDLRRTNWIQSRIFSGQAIYYPYKYKVQSNQAISEYYVYLRLAEQYLIRAEAKVQLNDIAGSQADLNIIRRRAGLNNTNATDKASILLAIEKERQVEYFAEWGHRWFDLKRTNRSNTVLATLKPATWQITDMLWPIPTTQLNLNPALVQNPGY